MKNLARKVTAIIILSVCILFMMTAFLRFIVLNVMMEKYGMDNSFTKAVFFDYDVADQSSKIDYKWDEIYPFPNTQEIVETGDSLEYIPHLISIKMDCPTSITTIKESIGAYTSDLLFGHDLCVSTYNKYNNLIKWNLNRWNYNNLCVLGDGYLSTYHQRADVGPSADNLNEFKRWLDGENVRFLQVIAPCKIYKSDSTYGIMDFSNQNCDKFLDLINDDINVLDLREPVYNEFESFHDAFFKTDHHWKPETGLWAAGKTIDYLNNYMDYNLSTKFYDSENYEFKIYKNVFSGSHSIKGGGYFFEKDDITIILPKFNVEVKGEFYTDKELVKFDGGFEKLYSKIPQEGDCDKQVKYGLYNHGSCNAIIDNKLNNNGIHCLIMGDSFRNAYAPFIMLNFDMVYIVDLRHFNGSIKSFVRKNNIDLVINIVHAGNVPFGETNTRDIFDFN